MMSPAGRENFFNKWWQVVGSIQKTNDLDVHIALLSAPSYAMEVKNKYYSRTKTPHQIIREHIDMFGFMQKNVNALDILIEDAKITLQSWGSPPPSFMLCNSKLTMQVTLPLSCSATPSSRCRYIRLFLKFAHAVVVLNCKQRPLVRSQGLHGMPRARMQMEWTIFLLLAPPFACHTVPRSHLLLPPEYNRIKPNKTEYNKHH